MLCVCISATITNTRLSILCCRVFVISVGSPNIMCLGGPNIMRFRQSNTGVCLIYAVCLYERRAKVKT